LKEAGVPAEVASAGTLGIVGHGAAGHAVEALAELGYDLSEHSSQGVSRELLRDADHVFVMAPEHELEINALHPGAHSKIHRLWEYADEQRRLTSIVDPVGCELEAFLRCRDDLVECLKNWIAENHGDP
jgi:protein-tyrosine-phosphatase